MNVTLWRAIGSQPVEYAASVEYRGGKWLIDWMRDEARADVVDDGTASAALAYIAGQVQRSRYLAGAYGYTPIADATTPVMDNASNAG